MADVLEDLQEPLVVICRFHRDMDYVRDVCQEMGRDCFELSGRYDELRTWKSMCHYERGCPVLAMQVQAGGVGISLVEASTAIWYSLGYSLTDYEQARARLHRPGQKRPVNNIHLIVKSTVDERVYRALSERSDLVQAVITGIQKGRA